LTRTDAEADFVVVASFAVTVSVLLPFLALAVTVAVSVDVPLPLVTDAELRFSDTPVVAPPTVRFTVPLYPVVAVTVTVKVADTLPLPDGRFTACELGEMLILNVGAAGAVTPSVADVVCVSVPSLPEIVKL
jgi:hypothetical protein